MFLVLYTVDFWLKRRFTGTPKSTGKWRGRYITWKKKVIKVKRLVWREGCTFDCGLARLTALAARTWPRPLHSVTKRVSLTTRPSNSSLHAHISHVNLQMLLLHLGVDPSTVIPRTSFLSATHVTARLQWFSALTTFAVTIYYLFARWATFLALLVVFLCRWFCYFVPKRHAQAAWNYMGSIDIYVKIWGLSSTMIFYGF